MDAVPAVHPVPLAATSTPAVSARAVRSTLAILAGATLVGLVSHALLHGNIQRPAAPVAPSHRLDLNRATHAQLRHLPGVGPLLADGIEKYRHDHGRFESVDELRKVPGIGPLTLERLRPHLVVTQVEPGSASVVAHDAEEVSVVAVSKSPARNAATSSLPVAPVDLNVASKEELQKLPGIGPTLSQRILEARAQNEFKSVDDLRRVRGIGAKTLAKLRPYVVVTPPRP